MICDTCANKNYCEPQRKKGEIIISCGAYKKPLTNADHIRAMSDEEMATFLYDRSDEYFFPMWTSSKLCVTTTNEILNTEQAWLRWLKSPMGGDYDV